MAFRHKGYRKNIAIAEQRGYYIEIADPDTGLAEEAP